MKRDDRDKLIRLKIAFTKLIKYCSSTLIIGVFLYAGYTVYSEEEVIEIEERNYSCIPEGCSYNVVVKNSGFIERKGFLRVTAISEAQEPYLTPYGDEHRPITIASSRETFTIEGGGIRHVSGFIGSTLKPDRLRFRAGVLKNDS
jgi:hypothetical protein